MNSLSKTPINTLSFVQEFSKKSTFCDWHIYQYDAIIVTKSFT